MTHRTIYFLIGMVVLSAPARAEDCPPDRPFKRIVTEVWAGTTVNQLNLVYCPPRLMCPAGTDRCSYVGGCPIPPPPLEKQICLSQDELDRAQK